MNSAVTRHHLVPVFNLNQEGEKGLMGIPTSATMAMGTTVIMVMVINALTRHLVQPLAALQVAETWLTNPVTISWRSQCFSTPTWNYRKPAGCGLDTALKASSKTVTSAGKTVMKFSREPVEQLFHNTMLSSSKCWWGYIMIYKLLRLIIQRFKRFSSPSYGNCYKFNTGDNDEHDEESGKRTSVQTGPLMGHSVVLQLNQKSYMTTGISEQAGARLVVHTPRSVRLFYR